MPFVPFVFLFFFFKTPNIPFAADRSRFLISKKKKTLFFRWLLLLLLLLLLHFFGDGKITSHDPFWFSAFGRFSSGPSHRYDTSHNRIQ